MELDLLSHSQGYQKPTVICSKTRALRDPNSEHIRQGLRSAVLDETMMTLALVELTQLFLKNQSVCTHSQRHRLFELPGKP